MIWHGRKTITFGVIGGRDRAVTSWSASATTLDFDGKQLPLFVSPNCRLMQLGDRTLLHDDYAGQGSVARSLSRR